MKTIRDIAGYEQCTDGRKWNLVQFKEIEEVLKDWLNSEEIKTMTAEKFILIQLKGGVSR